MDQNELVRSLKKIYIWIPSNSTAKALMKDLIMQLGGRCD
jgi:hypothetical protein